MKKIVQFAIQYPVTISMIVLGVILLGFISLRKLNVDLFPEMNAPRIFVEFKAGERPPEEMEKQYVENAEALAIRLKGVSQVSSVCMVGSARITVEYKWGTDMDEAFLDIQKGLSAFSQNTDITEFNITQHDPNASPVMLIAMANPAITDMNEMRKTGEDYIRNELIRLEGVADISLTGTEEKEIVIETNPYQLDAFGVTADQVVAQVQGMNRSVSGGSIVEMGTKYIIKGTALLTNVQDLGNIIITYKQGASKNTVITQTTTLDNKVPIYLKDVARVYMQNKRPDNIVRVNGKRCIGLSIYKETGYNTAKAVNEINKSLETIKKALPGYQFIVVQDQGKFINDSIHELRESGILGALIAILVLFVFLRNIGITSIVAFALPVSIIATFNLMYFNGLSINLMTLGGLALGAGMLVDNAVVVIENIFRKRERGLSVWDASIAGTSEICPAIISSTLTHIVVFLPIVYLHGASRALFKDQAWTVAFSLIASLFAAIFIIPMLYHSIYSNKKRHVEIKSLHFTWYSGLLGKIIDKRKVIIFIAALVLGATFLILPHIGSEYLPKSGTGEVSIDIKLKEGSQLQRTEGCVQGIETMLKEMLGDKAEIIYSQAGPSGISSSEKAVFQNENTASIKIKLSPEARKNSGLILEKIGNLLSTVPDAEINIIPDETALESTMGTNQAPIFIEVKGEDLKVLDNLTKDVKHSIAELPELTNIKTSIEEGAPEVDVVVDRTKASMYGLTTESIVSQLKDMLMGKDAGKFQSSAEFNTITLRMPDITLSEFNNILLKSSGNKVPLYEVAQIKETLSPKQLLRRDQNRIATVTAEIKGNAALDKVVSKVRNKITTIQTLPDYEIKVAGEESKRQDAMSSLGFALLLSVILVYMVMASQFESLIHPFTILLTIPLAGAGSLWAFFLLGKPLNMMAYIGIIMLAGIAVNNSILLVDAINRFKSEGQNLRDAIINAGQNRIRPILMTSLTTILALIPLTLGIGEGAALRAPMAIAVISGLSFSTMVSLVVIPCVYYVFDRNKKK
jgi:hydrophobic/amphiphilic exporter-1 (mainly G- bacteria), HAE1 family